jgi:hypothetical protein
MENVVADVATKEGGNIMPNGDRRGPEGMGPMTGRGAGFCNGANAPGFRNNGIAGGYGQGMGAGRGFGREFHGVPLGAGYGRGRGFGRGIQSPYISQNNPSYSKESEKEYIENEVSFLKEQLNALEGRLADMQEDE